MITANSNLGIALLALRAGPITGMEAEERWPSSGAGYFQQLRRMGYVEFRDGAYRITDAGRAACPLRNPLAGTVKPIPIYDSETDMSRENPITRQQVLGAIIAAGSGGITRKALIEQFNCPEGNIDNAIMNLNRQMPAVISKLAPGHFVAIDLAPAVKSTLASQIAQAPAMPLAEKITIALANATVALSAKQIHKLIKNPPDSETLTREIYAMKKAGRLEVDPEAVPPAGSRGNVGMYRLATTPPVEAKDYTPGTVVVKPGKEKHATRELILQFFEGRETYWGAIPLSIAQGIGCSLDSTRAVLLGMFSGLILDRAKMGDDFAYFVPEKTIAPQHTEPVVEAVQPAGIDAVAAAIDVELDTPAVTPSNPETVAALAVEVAPVVANPAVTSADVMRVFEALAPGNCSIAGMAKILRISEDTADSLITNLFLAGKVRQLFSGPVTYFTLASSSLEAIEEPALMPMERSENCIQFDYVREGADPDFAIWKSGALSIMTDEKVIELSANVVRDLRAYLGLFQEAA